MYNFSDFNLGQWKQYTIHLFYYCTNVLCSLQFLIIIFYSSHGDFVTIIDLPEGEHQYKFYVDGEWKHDPGVVCVWNKITQEHIEKYFLLWTSLFCHLFFFSASLTMKWVLKTTWCLWRSLTSKYFRHLIWTVRAWAVISNVSKTNINILRIVSDSTQQTAWSWVFLRS